MKLVKITHKITQQSSVYVKWKTDSIILNNRVLKNNFIFLNTTRFMNLFSLSKISITILGDLSLISLSMSLYSFDSNKNLGESEDIKLGLTM